MVPYLDDFITPSPLLNKPPPSILLNRGFYGMLKRDRKAHKVNMNKPFESNHRSMSNDVWETSLEIPYWWRVTTQIWSMSRASYSLKQISHAARRITSTTHIWVLTRQKYGISTVVPQTSIRGETSGDVTGCRLFSRANEFWLECKDEFLHFETIAFNGLVYPWRAHYNYL